MANQSLLKNDSIAVGRRRAAVEQMLANHAIEGFEPDAEDVALQLAYIEGRISLDDMLQAARNYVSRVQRQPTSRSV